MRDPIKVALVDEDELFLRQTRALLEGAQGITVMGEAQDEQGALELARERQPDVLLLSLGALRSNGPEIVAQVRALSPDTQVLVWNGLGQEPLVLEALRQGALGHLVRGQAQSDEIIQAIQAVNRGEAVLSPDVAGRVLDEVMQGLRER